METENEKLARECLKQVRFRSLPETSNQLDIDHLSGEDLKMAVYNERRLEFIGEAMRGIDVLRRGANFERKHRLLRKVADMFGRFHKAKN